MLSARIDQRLLGASPLHVAKRWQPQLVHDPPSITRGSHRLYRCTIAPPPNSRPTALLTHCRRTALFAPVQTAPPSKMESETFPCREYVRLASQKRSIPASLGASQGNTETSSPATPCTRSRHHSIEERRGSEAARGELKVVTHTSRVPSSPGLAIPSCMFCNLRAN